MEKKLNELLNSYSEIKQELNRLNELLNAPKQPLKYYKTRDLKDVFGWSATTIQDYREKGILPYSKIEGRYYYEVAAMKKMFDSNSSHTS